VSQNFRGFRAHYSGAALPKKDSIGAWAIVAVVMLVFVGLVAVRNIADTSAYGRLIRNPAHNAQCSASSSLTLDSRCPREEAQGEPGNR